MARSHLAKGDPTGWFEPLYQAAEGDESQIPWADMRPNPFLAEWLAANAHLSGRALVIGCGLGDDAEAVAKAGWKVTAFDVAASCVTWAKRRFPDSSVRYEVADLMAPPPEWKARFDLVVESYTLQSLPLTVRADALDAIQMPLRAGGRILLICRGRDDDVEPNGPPWALSRTELDQLLHGRLSQDRFADFYDDESPPKRRFVAVYRRPPSLLMD